MIALLAFLLAVAIAWLIAIYSDLRYYRARCAAAEDELAAQIRETLRQKAHLDKTLDELSRTVSASSRRAARCDHCAQAARFHAALTAAHQWRIYSN